MTDFEPKTTLYTIPGFENTMTELDNLVEEAKELNKNYNEQTNPSGRGVNNQ